MNRYLKGKWARVLTFSLVVAIVDVLAVLMTLGAAGGATFKGLGLPGLLGFVVAGVACLVGSILFLGPALRRTRRGDSVLRAIDTSGLTDVENRLDGTRTEMPPTALYDLAQHELFISGVTLQRLFDVHIAAVRRCLDRGVRVCALLLDPLSEDAKAQNAIEDRDIPSEINYTLDVVRRSGLLSNKGFQVRMLPRKPPFTAIVVDGYVDTGGVNSLETEAIIRLQPTAMHMSQHEGTIVEFEYRKRGPFRYFVDDLRLQWQRAKPVLA